MRWRTLLVVAVAVLALSAQPVAAQNATAVASEHTTFGTGSQGEPSPTETTNMSVDGSGESAIVSLDAGTSNVTTALASTTDSTSTSATDVGLLINPNADLGELRVSVDPDVSGATRLRVLRASDNTEIASRSISGSGDYTISADVSAGVDYRVVIDAEGSDYTYPNTDDSDWPKTSDLGNATASTYNDGSWTNSTSNAYGLDEIRFGSGVSSGRYVGAGHDAENVTEGWTNLQLDNATAEVIWQEDSDGDGAWTNVTSTSYSSSGNVTADLSSTQSDRWRVRVDVEVTGDNPTAEIHDEGLLFAPATPTISDPDPGDGSQISSYDGDVSVNLSDADFGLSQGDSVTVTATNASGGQIGSQTVTANGTVTISYTALAGENTIAWTATDAYGHNDTLTQTFETPGVIEVRNESAPDEIIDSASNLTATFYGADGQTVVQKTSSDGTIPVSGVPTDTEYVVSVNANGYRPRRVVLENLFEQRSVYLLPDTADAATIEFELNDRTGNFPSSSELHISKPITRNNSTDFVAIAADSFGATGSTRFVLQDNSRYLLRVESPDGSVREIGSYTTSGDAVEPIPIGRVSVGSTIDSGSALQTGYITEDGQTYLRVTYVDPDGQTEELTYKVVNESGAVIEPERTVDVSDEYRATIPVNSTGAATVNYSYTRQVGGESISVSGNASVGGVPNIAKDWPIDQQVVSLSGYLLIVGVTGLLVIRDPGVASIAGTVVASLLTFIGVVEIPFMALGVAGVTAVLYNVGRR